MKNRLILAVAISSLTVLAACSKGPEGKKYVCADKTEFYLATEGVKAVLNFAGEDHDLKQVPTASGSRYVNAEFMFFSKGGEAMLGEGETLHKQCVRQ
ncbi:MliC family protein [Motilimonas pumila]|uniref:C-type lysozyme inhibitor domain-containing protein n=1 Tax=Motilimonas pumila TaxID=2303987 RepID=A0A418YDB5_9GAMM|nr:MliC family protein [Motilimonas pumila]RJG42522.1 hypothetical protein D1Z90_12720 [Motilimonas pumila]